MLKFMSITILIALFIFSCSRLGDRYMGVNFVISNYEDIACEKLTLCFLSFDTGKNLLCRDICGRNNTVGYINYPNRGKYYISIFSHDTREVYRSGIFEFGHPPYKHDFGHIDLNCIK